MQKGQLLASRRIINGFWDTQGWTTTGNASEKAEVEFYIKQRKESGLVKSECRTSVVKMKRNKANEADVTLS